MNLTGNPLGEGAKMLVETGKKNNLQDTLQ